MSKEIKLPKAGINHDLSFLHRVGNTIGAIICIAQNLVKILTFSYYIPYWSIRFSMWRMGTKLYGDRKIK
jgi:hypothetical protein